MLSAHRLRRGSAVSARAVRKPLTRSLYLDSSPKAARRAREVARRALLDWSVPTGPADAIVLLVSELVSNALLHGAGVARIRHRFRDWRIGEATRIVLRLRLAPKGSRVRIEVWDAAPNGPRRINPSATEEHGRGMDLVEALGSRWGVRRMYVSGGKVVWCDVALEDRAENAVSVQGARAA